MSQKTWLLVKGTPTWVYKRVLILNCISSIHILYIIHVLLCYIPSILDNSCVSELRSSQKIYSGNIDEDCKSMPTPMVMDLKKMNEASTD
jgi:hypothetical protein